MRIALLSYRSKTHCGGQGVYIRYLSSGLVELGHRVEVFSGQPYPEVLDPRVVLRKVPSLDMYREPDPFRIPRPSEIRDRIDLLELATVWTAGFPEPRTFSLRMARLLADRQHDFDVVHDNQSLGFGLLDISAMGFPVVATVHHPITRDRVLELSAARWWRKPLVHRWYGFLKMQQRVARSIPDLVTVSSSSAADITADFGVRPDQLCVVPLGVDTDLFAPADQPRVPGRIIAVASADTPLKGVGICCTRWPGCALTTTSRFSSWPSWSPTDPPKSSLPSSASPISCTPPTGSPTPSWLVCWRLPKLPVFLRFTRGSRFPPWRRWPAAPRSWPAGPGIAGGARARWQLRRLVRPGDTVDLIRVLGALLASPGERQRLGAAGRRRALEVYSWESVAAQTVAVYERAIARKAQQRGVADVVGEPC
ncbi:glycosyl transferase 4-like domain protein [Mycobacterium xenopi 3993]|nr:glycosyl transferase 4-like domain protein [Mycobacterium xenopi 3993]